MVSPRNERPEPQEVDDSSAKVKLLRVATGRGDADAPVSLANLYLEGKEVSRSCDQALGLLKSAAAKPTRERGTVWLRCTKSARVCNAIAFRLIVG